MIPAGFIQELVARADVVEVVGRHVALKKAGINFKGLCPFHGEKTPSFIVSPTRQTYHCFGCQRHGNALRFLMEHTGAGFVDAVQDLAQQVGLQVPEDSPSPEERLRAARVLPNGIPSLVETARASIMRACPRPAQAYTTPTCRANSAAPHRPRARPYGPFAVITTDGAERSAAPWNTASTLLPSGSRTNAP